MNSRSILLYIFTAMLLTITAELTFAQGRAVRVARAAQATDCNSIITIESFADLQSRIAEDVRYVEKNQIDIYLNFRHKVAARRAAGLADPLNVSMPIFRNSLEYMQAELRATARELTRRRLFRRMPNAEKINLRSFVENLIREGDVIEQAGVPYQRFVDYSFLFTVARSHALGIDLSSDTITLSQYNVETANSYLKKHKDVVFIPQGPLYFPVVHPLAIDDFIAIRATPIFFIGAMSNMTRADGFTLNPTAFFQHDLSHSGIMLSEDNFRDNYFALPDSFFQEKYERYKTFYDKVLQIRNPTLHRAVTIVLFEYLHEIGISADNSNALHDSDAIGFVSGSHIARKLIKGFYGHPRQLGQDSLKEIEKALAWVQENAPPK